MGDELVAGGRQQRRVSICDGWRRGYVGPAYSGTACSTDGATRKPDGDLGIVMKSGLNLQYTDLAPGGSVPMVRLYIKRECVASTDSRRLQHRTPSLDYNILSA